MSLEAARRWLEQHTGPLPVHAATLERLQALLQETPSCDRLVEVLEPDPVLGAALLRRVNAGSKREPIESLPAAASLIGEAALLQLLRAPGDSDDSLDRPHQRFLYRQLLERSSHNAWQVSRCAESLGYGDLDSLRTAARLMYLGELHCCAGDFEAYRDVIRQGGDEKAAEAVYGFEFSELGQVIAERDRLPERVVQAQPHRQSQEAKTRLLRLTTRLCRHCERGWQDERVTADLQQLSELMQRPIEEIARRVHATAVEAARHSHCEDAWHAASRLPLIQDGPWMPPVEPTAKAPESKTAAPPPVRKPPPRGSATRDRLQQLLRKPETTQSQLLQACLQGLHEELGFTRVSLFLLSRDRRLLQNRLAIGLDPQAPLRRYAVDTERAGLLQRLMEKPQALHLTPANWTKYERLIPVSLLARLDNQDLVLMSLFIADKPIGLILADRKGSSPIADEDFAVFKQVVSLCSKALTLLARRKPRAE